MKSAVAPPARLATTAGTGPETLIAPAAGFVPAVTLTFVAVTNWFVFVTCSTAVTNCPTVAVKGLGSAQVALRVGTFGTIWLLLLTAAAEDTAKRLLLSCAQALPVKFNTPAKPLAL